MKTDALIDLLAKDNVPVRRHILLGRMLLALALGLLVTLAILGKVIGFRPDIGIHWQEVALKAVFCAALMSVFLMGLSRLSRPISQTRPALMVLALVAGSLFLIFCCALLGQEKSMWFEAWMGTNPPKGPSLGPISLMVPWCVVLIPFYAIPTALGLGWAMRQAAPVNLSLAGAFSGALAGSIGAIVYASHCSIDSPAFVSFWYGMAIGICAIIGAILGPKLLRW